MQAKTQTGGGGGWPSRRWTWPTWASGSCGLTCQSSTGLRKRQRSARFVNTRARRSPWGLWTTKTRNWFRVNRARYGGIGESAFGTLRLITSLALALGSFFYFRAHIAAEQALSIAQFAIINASVALFKVWWALFFDYRDARAAFVVIMFATFFNVAAAVIAGVVAEESPGLGWTSFGLLLFHALTLAYLTAMSWNWQVHTGMTRKQARALDVARGLDSEM